MLDKFFIYNVIKGGAKKLTKFSFGSEQGQA